MTEKSYAQLHNLFNKTLLIYILFKFFWRKGHIVDILVWPRDAFTQGHIHSLSKLSG